MLSLNVSFNLALIVIAMLTNRFVVDLIDKTYGAPMIGTGGDVIVVNKTNNNIIQKKSTDSFWQFPVVLCEVWNEYIDGLENRTIDINSVPHNPNGKCEYESNNPVIIDRYGTIMSYEWISVIFSIVILLIAIFLDAKSDCIKTNEPHKCKCVLSSVFITTYIISFVPVLLNIATIMSNLINNYPYECLIKNEILTLYAGIIVALFCNTLLIIILEFMRS